MSKQIPQVAILIGTGMNWGRRVIRGISNYLCKHGPWQLKIEASVGDESGAVLQGWHGQGIIARISNDELAKELRSFNLPMVNVSMAETQATDIPRVATNAAKVSLLAVRYFLDRGFSNFAFYDYQTGIRLGHMKTFVESLAALGHNCAVYSQPADALNIPGSNSMIEHLADWLKEQAKPLAVFVSRTGSGHRITAACHHAGLMIPEEVAILTADDDLLNEVCHPQLSGFIVAAEELGYRAAELLDQIMHGEKVSAEPILLDPIGIRTRASTEVFAIDDADLVAAIRYINQHATDPIRVSDVVRAGKLSRRALERRFEQVLGRTPAAEIRRVQLDRSKQLLSETDTPISGVAKAAGFGSAEYMSHVFRTEVGITPLKYRSRVRGR